MSLAPCDAVEALSRLPEGTCAGRAGERRYLVTRRTFGSGRSVKLFAQELGGNDVVSLNFYVLRSGPRMYPCEMSLEKVLRFLDSFVPDQPEA